MKFNIAPRRVIFGLLFGMPFLNQHLYAANITYTQFTIKGILEDKTCSFNETALTIDLPEVDTRTLNNNNAIQGKTEFTLSLNCSGSVTSVNIIPSGTPISNSDDTLYSNIGTSRNVGLRILDKNGNSLKPDGQNKVSFDYYESSGKYTFTAGYVATGTGRVSGGSFKSIVTFSVEYS
ncbi:fimbrial protein [Enterobacter ludwigii]|jgi:type 1 fimbria pilin|uniref:fimbrial protein n=1 Tax=Enterobacter ludwigii TaxID=299767 RepID=UPI00129C58BA|nr:fimbrial protein [Enterobacter ludwigii]MRI48207.1 fimbrial protein [Enterobacter ludwigii]